MAVEDGDLSIDSQYLRSIDNKFPATLGKKTSDESLSVVQADPERTVAGHSTTVTGSAQPLSAVSIVYRQIYWKPESGAAEIIWGGSDVQDFVGVQGVAESQELQPWEERAPLFVSCSCNSLRMICS